MVDVQHIGAARPHVGQILPAFSTRHDTAPSTASDDGCAKNCVASLKKPRSDEEERHAFTLDDRSILFENAAQYRAAEPRVSEWIPAGVKIARGGGQEAAWRRPCMAADAIAMAGRPQWVNLRVGRSSWRVAVIALGRYYEDIRLRRYLHRLKAIY